MLKAVGALVMFIVPLIGGSVACFASDPFWRFGEREVGSEFGGGVVAGEAIFECGGV
jgi:hypothetical protein